MKKILMLLILSSVTLTACACSDKTDDETDAPTVSAFPVTTEVVYTTAAASETSVTVKDMLFTVSYSGNPTTGYSWDYEILSGTDIISVKSTDEPTAETAAMDGMGIGGDSEFIYTFTVTGTAPGAAVVRFYYARPWDRENSLAEEHIYDITITDDLSVASNHR